MSGLMQLVAACCSFAAWSEAHLSYWHPLGSGYMEIVNNSLHVEATYSRRLPRVGRSHRSQRAKD